MRRAFAAVALALAAPLPAAADTLIDNVEGVTANAIADWQAHRRAGGAGRLRLRIMA